MKKILQIAGKSKVKRAKGVTHLKGTCQAEKAIPKTRKGTFLVNIFELPSPLPLPQFRYV
jgi:hypothetical protein